MNNFIDICRCTGNCPISDQCYRYMKPCSHSNYETYSSLEDICIPNNYSELIPYIQEKE